MAEQICPVCGCTVAPSQSFEKDGQVYCCEPCATGVGQCQCGCCEIPEEE
jgi:hypothetical protein